MLNSSPKDGSKRRLDHDAGALTVAVVGAGRMGRALVRALPAIAGPFGRGFDGAGYEVILLAVPDGEIAVAAAAVTAGRLVGHCSGAEGLQVLAPHAAFSIHPLMTVTGDSAEFGGASAAIAGSSAMALAVARSLAARLGLQSVEIADADRPAYHAAASMAANFLTTLEDAAETLIRTAGGDRAMLVPLVRAAVENWAAVGGRDALTGPISRGDDATTARQRAAVGQRTPELLELFDVLAARTRALAATQRRR
ncbi:MAG: Rossmann-like and DUF2520 domain-containing protein [Ilumatobacteraceae bacterium]